VLVYLSIYLAPVIEGEVVYTAMCARALHGDLFWPAVLACGALGGATGDQIWFYLLRGRIHWLDRYPRLGKYRDRVVHHVRAHENLLVLVSRFLPGLRTAIPIACAYAGMRAAKFSALNLISAFLWAASIMALVKWSSSSLSALGLNAWWGPLIPAMIVILFFRWLSSPTRRSRQQ
jgi:membrane protein DedA with SNARE-associated domain